MAVASCGSKGRRTERSAVEVEEGIEGRRSPKRALEWEGIGGLRPDREDIEAHLVTYKERGIQDEDYRAGCQFVGPGSRARVMRVNRGEVGDNETKRGRGRGRIL